MEERNYTIKDIAELAGVSAGTVDRVLHNRGDVSPRSRAKVQKVLDEIHYEPNVFAIGLAAKKRYTFLCLLPLPSGEDYWHSVAAGVERARKELQAFNVSVGFRYYRHGSRESYAEACREMMKADKVDAVLIAPNFREETETLVAHLGLHHIIYAFVDYDMEESEALTYIGQDSRKSGYLAAKLLMNNYTESDERELALFLSNTRDNPAEIQMNRRMEGFMEYISTHYPTATTHEVILNKSDAESNHAVLDAFFQSHPKATLGAVFNSRVYRLGEYLKQSGRRMQRLIGYDLLASNVDLLRSGEVHYLIGQRPELQGYCGVKALCDAVVFKKEVDRIRYMPIDILTEDNIDFYFEFI